MLKIILTYINLIYCKNYIYESYEPINLKLLKINLLMIKFLFTKEKEK